MKVAICAIIKDEGKYIREWIAYHSLIGFDHFFLFDNESTDDTQSALQLASDFGICTFDTIVSIENKRAQLEAYKIGLQKARDKYEWVIFLDADEFINLKKHSSIKDFLSDFSNFDAIGINWRMFGDNAHNYYAKGLVTERFTKCSNEHLGPNYLIKTIVKTRQVLEPYIHTHKLVEGAKFVNSAREDLKHFPAARQEKIVFDTIQINHYFTKSREEWEIKRLRGKADFPPNSKDRIRNAGEFEMNNKNDIKDDSMLAFGKTIKAKILEIFCHI